MRRPTDERERERAFQLIRQHGWNATAFQTLGSGYSYFFQGGSACVAYVDTGDAWVAAGPPIAPRENLATAASSFIWAAREAGKRCCFFATEDRLQSALRTELSSLRIGEQPTWDPRAWPAIVTSHRSLREQLRRARKKGVQVRRLAPEELLVGPMREAITKVLRSWLATRSMAPMGFLVHVEPFDFAEHRALFVAEWDGRVVAFAGVIPVPARAGFFVEDLVRDPSAPNGTSELLIDAAMHWAASVGAEWLTLGLAPLAGEVPRALRLARRAGRVLYDFDGLRTYKAKLRPHAWSPIHLTYPATQGALVSVLDALTAFTHDGWMRFGLRTLKHAARNDRNRVARTAQRVFAR